MTPMEMKTFFGVDVKRVVRIRMRQDPTWTSIVSGSLTWVPDATVTFPDGDNYEPEEALIRFQRTEDNRHVVIRLSEIAGVCECAWSTVP